MAVTPSNQRGIEAPMKSRVFTIISLFALLVAMMAAGTASAQSPSQDVYNPNGEVLDVVSDGGNDSDPADETPAPSNEVESDVESGQSPTVCSQADGRDANGNAVNYGSSADCATTADVCAAADGKDANGNAVSYGSSADCDTTVAVSSGQLPFTGFQAGLVALAGFGLLGAGFAMRRMARGGTAV